MSEEPQDKSKVVDFEDERVKKVAREFKKAIEKGMQGERRIASARNWNPYTGISASAQSSLSTINSENIGTWLNSPLENEAKLRELSNLLFNASGEYKSLVKYYADMARFYPVVELNQIPEKYSPLQLKEQMNEITETVRKLNLSHEKSKIWLDVLKEDVFYGYEIEDDDSFFFLKLNPNYCRLSGYSDGMWLFEFDFSYFDTVKNESVLESYPSEFRVKYRRYQDRKSERRWQEIDPKKSIVYKFNETQQEIVPPLSSTFEGLMELKDYKKLKKVGTKIDNYLILHQKVPLFRDTDKNMKQNNFMISSDTMMLFHEMLSNSLPEEIGAVVSPMDIEPVKLEKTHNPSDKVQEALRDIYSAAGVNQNLFNPEKNSTAGLSRSIKKDELLVINFYKQVERWLNRKIKLMYPEYRHWNVNLVKTSGLSESEYADFLIKIGSLGYPVVGTLGALLGHDMTKIDALTHLENNVLNIKQQMVPFASTHTGGLQSEGGRPQMDDVDLSDSGVTTRDANDTVEGTS